VHCWLAVDLIARDGRGLCAELVPELITIDKLHAR
jgi:hypothetical protein